MNPRRRRAHPRLTASSEPGTPEQPTPSRSIGVGDRIALLALLISAATAAWQLAGFLMGPTVELVPPTSVTFRYWPAGDREAVALTATTMNYLNDGRKDYDGLVIDEVAELKLHGLQKIRLNWWWFVGPDGSPLEQAHPVVAPGAGLTAHETRFVPLIQTCKDSAPCGDDVSHANFLRWERFLELGSGSPTNQPVVITFSVKVRERTERTLVYSCKAWLDSRTRAAMTAQKAVLIGLHAKGLKPGDIVDNKEFREYFSMPCVQ